MQRQSYFWVTFLTAIFVPAAWALAAEQSPAEPASKSTAAAPAEKGGKAPAANETIDQLIQQLDSPDFAKREAACGKLAAKGGEAISALEKAAVTGDLEVCSRSLSVLDKLLKSSDEKTAKAAENSLQRLVDSDSSTAARKAKAILDKKNGTANNNGDNNPFPFGGGGIIVPNGMGAGRIIINGGTLRIGGGGAAFKSVSVSNTNGVRHIKATDGDKTVKIDDDPANGIKIEATDKVDGKEVTKKYEAKNAEELKKKQPEGYKIYKEYDQQGNGGAIQLQMGNVLPAVPVQPGIVQVLGVPAPVIGPAIRPIAPAPPTEAQVAAVATRLKVITEQLEAVRKNDVLKNASAENKAELKKQVDELTQSVEELRKELDKGK